MNHVLPEGTKICHLSQHLACHDASSRQGPCQTVPLPSRSAGRMEMLVVKFFLPILSRIGSWVVVRQFDIGVCLSAYSLNVHMLRKTGSVSSFWLRHEMQGTADALGPSTAIGAPHQILAQQGHMRRRMSPSRIEKELDDIVQQNHFSTQGNLQDIICQVGTVLAGTGPLWLSFLDRSGQVCKSTQVVRPWRAPALQPPASFTGAS